MHIEGASADSPRDPLPKYEERPGPGPTLPHELPLQLPYLPGKRLSVAETLRLRRQRTYERNLRPAAAAG